MGLKGPFLHADQRVGDSRCLPKFESGKERDRPTLSNRTRLPRGVRSFLRAPSRDASRRHRCGHGAEPSSALPLGSATAYRVATSVTQAGQVVTGNTPSGWTWKVTSSGQNTVLDSLSRQDLPRDLRDVHPLDRHDLAGGPHHGARDVSGTGSCSGLGTIEIDFSQPVKNPVVHLMGIGAQASNGGNGSIFHVIQTLSSSTPAGATLGAPNASSANMTGERRHRHRRHELPGQHLLRVDDDRSHGPVGRGSVPVVGHRHVGHLPPRPRRRRTPAPAPPAPTRPTRAVSSSPPWGLRRRARVVRHQWRGVNVVGDLTLGSAIDEDNATTVANSHQPQRRRLGAAANGANGDACGRKDAISSWPSLTTPMIGSSVLGQRPDRQSLQGGPGLRDGSTSTAAGVRPDGESLHAVRGGRYAR